MPRGLRSAWRDQVSVLPTKTSVPHSPVAVNRKVWHFEKAVARRLGTLQHLNERRVALERIESRLFQRLALFQR